MSDTTIERLRAANPVPQPPPAVALAALIGGWPAADQQRWERADTPRIPRRRRAGRFLTVALPVAVSLAIGLTALLTLHVARRAGGAGQQAGAARQSELQHTLALPLLSTLAVLRRAQTAQDLNPTALKVIKRQAGGQLGTPVLSLMRLAMITPWGAKVFLVPIAPPHPAAPRGPSSHARHAQWSVDRLDVLQLYGASGDGVVGGGACCAPALLIRRGAGGTWGGKPGGPSTGIEVVPDGVARVALLRSSASHRPFAVASVHGNVAAVEYRGIEGDPFRHMIWYGSRGHVIKRIRLTRARRHSSPARSSSAARLLTALVKHFAIFRRAQPPLPHAAAVQARDPDRAFSEPVLAWRYVPISRTFGVWVTVGSSGACLDWQLAASAAPQTDAGVCDSSASRIDVGGMFGEATTLPGHLGRMLVALVPDGTRSVRITLTNGRVVTPTPQHNIVAIREPAGAGRPFAELQIESVSGHVTSFCRSCRKHRPPLDG